MAFAYLKEIVLNSFQSEPVSSAIKWCTLVLPSLNINWYKKTPCSFSGKPSDFKKFLNKVKAKPFEVSCFAISKKTTLEFIDSNLDSAFFTNASSLIPVKR